MTENPAQRADKLARELDAAFQNRADLYRLIYAELEASYGEAEAEAILTRAVTRRGEEVAGIAFARFGPGDARQIGEAFLAVSPDGGNMYPTNVDRREDGISFYVKRCPLKDAWLAAGLEGDRLATMCRIAGAFDRGLFEATGIRFENTTWTPGHGSGCCHIHLSNG